MWFTLALLLIGMQVTITFGISRTTTYHIPFHANMTGAALQSMLGNISQSCLILLAVLLMLRNSMRSRGLVRVFWTLMCIGLAFWAADVAIWAYYEVLRQSNVPSITIGDTFLFLHWVPMVAALAVRPDKHSPTIDRRQAWLDFFMLMAYWCYIYAFLVMPYQYVRPDLRAYNYNYDLLDRAGNWLLVAGLVIVVLNSKALWRRIYMILIVAAISYAVFSQVANAAIIDGTYYTGSAYDILWVATICWFAFAALEGAWMSSSERMSELVELSSDHRWSHSLQWHSLLGMAATVSTPTIGLYLLFTSDMDDSVRKFRIIVTLCAMTLLVVLVFLKQRLLQTALMHSLTDVSQAYSNLKQVQNQLVQSEKLASMGRLLAGAAHEINNPLTAIMGYSELIVTSSASAPQTRGMAEKIAQQARRTSTLVKDLLTFSQETPTQRSLNDIEVLVKHAVNIAGLETGRAIQVQLDTGQELPKVFVDPGQILQVFVHLIRNAADAMRSSAVRVLKISARTSDALLEVKFVDSGSGVREPGLVFDPFYTTKSPGQGTGLGLSACYGIIQKHGGQITCSNGPAGGAIFTVTLPASQSVVAEAAR